MADSIRIKRGVKADLPKALPLGELAYCTDTRQLFIGTGDSIAPVKAEEIHFDDLNERLEGNSQNINKLYKDVDSKINTIKNNISLLQEKTEDVNTVLETAKIDLGNKVDKDGSGQVTYSMLAQDAREQITGGNTAVVGRNAILEENITNEAITEKKTIFFEHFQSDNLFDKSSLKAGYLNADTAEFIESSDYKTMTDYKEIKSNTQYSVFLSGKPYGTAILFYNSNKEYLGRTDGLIEFKDPGVNTFTVPEGAYYYKVYVVNACVDTFALCLGSTASYSSYYSYYKLKEEYLPKKVSNFYTVSLDGGGDFTSVQSACDSASDGDYIIIYPGTYEECLDIKDRTLHLIGLSTPENTIILSTNDARDYPALEMCSGSAKNITFYSKKPSGASYPSYATPYGAHIDYDYEEDKTLIFENCVFRSDWNAAVGIGMRKGFDLQFRNCKFTSYYAGTTGAFFFHDSSNESLAGTYSLLLDNNIISSVGNYAMVCMGIGYAQNKLILTLTRNIFYSDVNGVSDSVIGSQKPSSSYPSSTGNKFMGTGTINLNTISFGNNIAKCNA